MASNFESQVEQEQEAARQLAAAVRDYRTRRRLTQQALGTRIGYSRQYVSMAESTRELPPETIIAALDRELGGEGALLDLWGKAGGGRVEPVRGDLDCDGWEEDLERTAAYLACQEFTFAESLLLRWLAGFEAGGAGSRAMALYGRSLFLLGDLRGQQGALDQARQPYQKAREVFAAQRMPRRAAQVDLELAVVAEMAGELDEAANQYRHLATDARLSPRDRARAGIWVGTAISKAGDHQQAETIFESGIRQFERLGEQEDWAVTHEKLALAHRGVGKLDQAARAIDTAANSNRSPSPLHRVRLTTARGHITGSDPGNLAHGMALLEEAAELAARHQLGHQLSSIRKIEAALAG
ncbi:helix-turn-helix transcriptional regulator [Amycolatopsis sp. 195334CR]|uniref:helix-turn-helix domain-containing protein n=1 Tax=Amycolatopsis sp. 195334CR TaxID=2814588 RepID=UPI001A8F7533|nr:helix-turn-helix transcriptional regulator [Amycolatopsis sp. 195334CR]MBN6034176.1 helix-turn-helix domain-containing protein [Amycolatopsis sp. 195334CR]